MAIVGTLGVPAAYSGFETLVEHLVRYNEGLSCPVELVVYCSARHFKERPASYRGAELRYLELDANNASSILYDAVSMASALKHGVDAILLLGVSGAIALPFVRLFSRAKIVTNIDGIEWRRDKWQGLAKIVLRLSERLAVRWSHHVVADNSAIVDYVRETYSVDSALITYGGDHALSVNGAPHAGLPSRYALALCRIEPENNVHTILEAFSHNPALPLVFIGNWARSEYGRDLKARYEGGNSLHLLDPIYDVARLRTIREGATLYVHGHSAGGTNPSLVEMMHFGKPIAAFDCVFNRRTTHDQALYFRDGADLKNLTAQAAADSRFGSGAIMKRIASDHYTWEIVGRSYFDLLRT
ncbi:glycosyltransferase [Brevundimonas basaltis]|uniref:Glycosyltransferase involved in cell wall biosynthesis n=1 Tax=Brevundimonas basaltis TaxID=472166 RepID=A0A7W8MI57_9CAUL|nr:glycosyltransferase involved in cell wall biosynthesis [Brevundimonas basaltis]